MWGREPSTVGSTLRSAVNLLRTWERLGVVPSFPNLGPFPVADPFGFGLAIGMIVKSLEPGRYAIYQQFESVRKLRAGYSNIFMTSLEGAMSLRTIGGDRVKYSLTSSPTQSLFFEQFSQGCIRRMGQEVHQDWAIPLPVMHSLWKAWKLIGALGTPPENKNR
jgi:hypothetical protein